SEVGNKTIGAKVNGKMVPLDTPLKTGDIVEVLTSKQSFGPSRDWIKIAQSSQAKNKIKQFFKKHVREESVVKGKELVEKEIKAQEFDMKEVLTTENIKRVIEKFNYTHEDDLYAAVGVGGITAQQIVNRLAEKMRKEREQEEALEKIVKSMNNPTPKKRTESGVIVKGIDNLLIRLSRCCTPVPGDDIVGFITKGRGVSVHRADCPNIQEDGNLERLIEVEWENDGTQIRKDYPVDIEISAFDRPGILNDVMHAVSEAKTNILAVTGRADREKIATIHLTIAITNISGLHRVVEKIKQLPDIYSVQRVIN
ncbi:MAG: ACT domain-containing protein, partial [Solibacillus isronensis]